MAVDINAATLGSAYALTATSFLIILSRIYLRKVKNEPFRLDDWIMLAAMPLYFVNTACYQVIIPRGSNLVAHPELLTQQEIDQRTLGAQFALLGRPFYMSYVWAMKACILIYYTRLTSRTAEIKIVKFTGVLLGLTWIGCMLSFFLECRPISGYIQVNPFPGDHCTAVPDSVITMGSTNIATDLLLMSIPLPIIFRAKLPLKTKLQLLGVFLVGLFVVGISITRMIIVLQNLTQINKLIWGQLECFAATLVANAPIIHGLIRHGLSKTSNFRSRSNTSGNRTNHDPSHREVKGSAIKLSQMGKMNDSTWQILPDGGNTSVERRESDDAISDHKYNGGIARTVEVRHESHPVDEELGMPVKREIRTDIYGGPKARK